jgi:hypothetical protein
MKKSLLFIAIIMTMVFAGCEKYTTETVEFMENEPVFMSVNEFRSRDLKTKPAQPIKEQGKICLYDGYLYISEPGKGIHIIDNRNPHLPKAAGFVELEGNTDLAVRNNQLYADSYVDLLWFDLADPGNPKYANRLENTFQYALPPIENEYWYDYDECFVNTDRSEKIIVGWNLKKRKKTYRHYYYSGDEAMVSDATAGSSMGQGVNGSMSRFSIYHNYLYTVMDNMMSIFDLSPEKPVKTAEDIYVGGDVETIFSYGENLFMGTPTGMMIYSVKDPLKPEYMSRIWHAWGCDPVVVENDIAYVTVHAGNLCGQNTNELIVIDVSDIRNPAPIVSYTMKKPKGLGIDKGTLFVCDDGLKIFDASEPQKILANQLVHYSGMEGYDVIPYNNVLMMIAEDGLYQYDYSDLKKISRISKINIGK